MAAGDQARDIVDVVGGMQPVKDRGRIEDLNGATGLGQLRSQVLIVKRPNLLRPPANGSESAALHDQDTGAALKCPIFLNPIIVADKSNLAGSRSFPKLRNGALEPRQTTENEHRLQGLDDLIVDGERPGFQNVIAVEIDDVVSPGKSSSSVSRRRSSLVRFHAHQSNRIAEALEHGIRAIGGGIIHDDDLAAWISLRQRGLNRIRNEVAKIVASDDNAKFWKRHKLLPHRDEAALAQCDNNEERCADCRAVWRHSSTVLSSLWRNAVKEELRNYFPRRLPAVTATLDLL